MQKIFLVAVREFKQRVRSRGFIIGTLLMPAILLIVSLVSGFTAGGSADQTDLFEELNAEREPYGYVDFAGLIRSIPEDLQERDIRSYSKVQSAKSALARGQISHYFVIQPDYRQTGDVQRVSLEIPGTPPNLREFNRILTYNLLSDTNTDETAVLISPFGSGEFQTISLSPKGETGSPSNSFLPFAVTIAIILPLFTSASYLLQSLTQEKSNRVMEILLGSLRPIHLLAGKLAGVGLLTLVQFTVWGLLALIAGIATGQEFSSLLSTINFTIPEIILIVPFALAGFLLYAGVMSGIGALSPDMEASRTWVFVITLPMMIPIYLWMAITNAPNGALALALSIFPFSAPVAMLMRMTTTQVPTWQIASSLGLLLLTGIGMIWLIARLFRVQTLLSGEAPSIRRFWQALQTS
jgi:ABC-2 type transport system permease protein